MKLLVDSGEATTMDEAIATFSQYGVRVVLGADVAESPALQIIALTVINTAARSFQGNVQICGTRDIELVVHGFEGIQLSDFSTWAGVHSNSTQSGSWPEIYIGTVAGGVGNSKLAPWAVGWSFGIGGKATSDADAFVPACVAAGALAVSEAFSILRGDSPYAGRRAMCFSLWSMKADLAQPSAGTLASLDRGLWLIGLGHLGQAYCWTLGLMRQQHAIQLVLQDIDIVTESTLTTSVLSGASDLKRMKTRTVAAWMERRGFGTRIVERRFDAATHVAATEPMTALFGVDNPSARRICEGAGFSTVLDAGLGSGYSDFRALRVRGFPGTSSAARIWAGNVVSGPKPLAPAYQALVTKGADPCGVTTLATRSVGAPFVGCYAAAMLVAELMRRRAGEAGHNVIDLSLRNPELVETA
ncbi:hypothetical protein ASE07_04990 [Noviherbaspirillum sp. Root189]|nr:hypothetical protein ASE07_04990 [Noviherbaspirillum sp. Root189]